MAQQPASSPPFASTLKLEDDEILDNIDGRMNGPMIGFWKKFFSKFDAARLENSLESRNAARNCHAPDASSDGPSPEDFLPWFSGHVQREATGARGSWHILDGKDRETDHGSGLLFTITGSATSQVQPGWEHVQVIGHFHIDASRDYRTGLVQLCRSANHVFASQPARLFLHGFYIRGSLVEFWVFDRSGLYCSEVFSMREDLGKFLTAIHGYQKMTDQELGTSNAIETDEIGSYVTLHGDDAEIQSTEKLYIQSKPIASREGIVGPGMTCYKARKPTSQTWDCILKFKWRWLRERPEDELLRLVEAKNIHGCVSLDYYREAESTAELRSGLRWGPQKRFREGTNDSNRDGDHTASPGFSVYTEETNNFFQNRIVSYIVTSPLGRPLHTFKSPLELCRVFRDCIKCHRSLFQAGILHQDISEGNLIIVDGASDDTQLRGILIDLDSAILIDEGDQDDEPGIVGTRPFMAIGVLNHEKHTWRHDLESFLYVLLWTVITHGLNSPPETSLLRQWSNGSWSELAVRKSQDMSATMFPRILQEFPTELNSLRPVAESLHQVLFPRGSGGERGVETGNSSLGADQLYDDVVDIFDKAIGDEEEK